MRSLYPWPPFPPDLDTAASRSLSMQFILQEWISCCDIIASIQEKPLRFCSEEYFAEEILQISEDLQKFLLFSLENPFVNKAGSLDKLCFYTEKLLLTSLIEENNTLSNLLDQMRDLILSFRSKMSIWKKDTPPLTEFLLAREQLCCDLGLVLRNYYHALLPFFEESRFDENILFYLIEHKDAFNRCLAPKKVEHLLSQLYPSGPTHLRAILREGYTRRGFADFYTRHEGLIESVEWPAEEWTSAQSH